uniref:Uncharacterized protein n=1 Tax=Lepeophtheirus salmonis TaxID=72036 RepID=A0A0K2TRK0_LEPSM
MKRLSTVEGRMKRLDLERDIKRVDPFLIFSKKTFQ